MSNDEIFGALRAMIEPFIRKSLVVSRAAAIYHDLGIGGDDAGELLDAIHDRLGTDFRDLHFDRYFPNEGEVFSEHILKLLGFRKKAKWRRLTVGHLIDVIQKGAWFEPPAPL
ncbi:MAG TPA: DUF1493 family protein [Rhizomicrobium sp.]|nr:DUF1493 family protein [Rhizomicrobium sp.]